MAIPTHAAHEPTSDIIASLERYGAVVIENLLGEGVVDGISQDLRPEFDREGHLYQNTFNGHQTLRVGGVTKYSRHFPTLLLHPLVLEVADAILKPHCEVYQVGSTTAIEILPGEGAQVLHADDTCYPSHLLPFEAQISALWALDDQGTLEFMSFFYDALAKGKKASEALNQAMRCMRESGTFKEVKYWAPFVLIGDDVKLDFNDI